MDKIVCLINITQQNNHIILIILYHKINRFSIYLEKGKFKQKKKVLVIIPYFLNKSI